MTSEEGSVGMVGIAMVVLVAGALLAAAQLTTGLAAVRVGDRAADGAALGAADQLALGNGCAAAREVAEAVARANRAEVVAFECPGREVTVTVVVADMGSTPVRRRSRAVVDPCVRCV